MADVNKETAKQEKLKKLDEFKESLKSKSFEELQKIEQEIIEKNDKINKEVTEKMFNLPEENYKEAAEGIRLFLNKQTVGWQYTLGMVVLYEFWDPERYPKEINYPTLDSTLRTIGELQFTGYDEWQACVTINRYFEPLHQEYVDATEPIYEAAAYHNVVMDAMNLNKPMNK